jgi:hypothetical protein
LRLNLTANTFWHAEYSINSWLLAPYALQNWPSKAMEGAKETARDARRTLPRNTQRAVSGCFALFLFHKAITVAGNLHNVGMMQQAVEHQAGKGRAFPKAACHPPIPRSPSY